MASDIIAAFSRFRSFTVVARSSSFAEQERAADVRGSQRAGCATSSKARRAGSPTGCGSPRKPASMARAGRSFGPSASDDAVAEVFDFQDRITEAVAMLAEPRIQAAEIARSRRERPRSLASYDVYLRSPFIASRTATPRPGACRSTASPPPSMSAASCSAWTLEHRSTMGWRPFGADDRARCAELARRGRHARDVMILSHCGMALLQGAREYGWGMAVPRSAVEANPNNPMVLVRAAVGHLHCGSSTPRPWRWSGARTGSAGRPRAHSVSPSA